MIFQNDVGFQVVGNFFCFENRPPTDKHRAQDIVVLCGSGLRGARRFRIGNRGFSAVCRSFHLRAGERAESDAEHLGERNVLGGAVFLLPLHAKECVDADAERFGEQGEKRDIGIGEIIFPFGHGLERDAEQIGKCALRHTACRAERGDAGAERRIVL